MTTNELIYKYKLEADKLDSESNSDLPLPTIIMILNKTILNFVKANYGLQRDPNIAIERSQKTIDDLQVLVEKDEPNLTYTKVDDNLYTASFASLIPDTYLHLLRSYTLADKEKCRNTALVNFQVSHDELNEVLRDPNRSPSFEWQEIPILIAKNKIYAYTDTTFVPKECHIDFLKYPTKIDKAGYPHIDGTASTDVDSELPDSVLEDIATLAAKFTSAILQSTEQYQILTRESELNK